MRTNIKQSTLLACLASAWLFGSQATAGTLVGAQATAPATVNLTLQGSLDWAHWGLSTPTDFDQKSGGANQISNFTQITGVVPNAVNQFGNAATAFWWNNGTPTASGSFTASGIWVAGLTNGFQFTVAADTTVKELKVYAGAWNAQVHFEARLSDGSAPAYVDESFDDFGSGGVAVYTVKFAANSAGQTLTIKIYSSALNHQSGNCTLLAASLGTPATGAGRLSASDTFLGNGAVVNLTSEGTLDWAHWGLATETDFNHKAGVTPQKISNVTPLNSGFFLALPTSLAACTWTDGTPTLTSSNTSSLQVYGEGTGFQFTVPADPTTKLLQVYVNAYSARVRLEATLSDNSATALSDDSFDTAATRQGPVRVYTVRYAAGATGQTLTVKCTMVLDEGSGWISLQAATLQAAPVQTGVLSGTYSEIGTASDVNLTADGRIDWAHWGLHNDVTGTFVDRKIGGTNQISDFHTIGLQADLTPAGVSEFGDNFATFSWTDGTPTPSASKTSTGIWPEDQSNGNACIPNGFELSAPADPSIRAFKIYLGNYAARVHFEAFLSDGSAPPFVDESYNNPSDGPNRVYTLTYAAASTGQKLTVRWWTLRQYDQWGNTTLMGAVLRQAAPVVNLTAPAGIKVFYPASGGLSFTASTINPFSIAADQIGLSLNGADVSSSLVVSGSPTARVAAYSGLMPNKLYSAQFFAVDNLGNGTTNAVNFDTFSTNGAVVIEAEDYNFTTDYVTGGLFTNNPVPGAYAGLFGLAEVDYHTGSALVSVYRPSDPLGIQNAYETRAYFGAAPNYVVSGLNAGDWQNYTRAFPNARYQVYLRYGTTQNQAAQLDLVTNPTGYSQTLQSVGLLNTPAGLNEALYRYAVLTDTSGNPITVALSGLQTLRLTAVTATSVFGGLAEDFLILVPAAAQRPRLTVSLNAGQVMVSFPTEDGFTYTLQYQDRLTDAWQSAPTVPGDGTVKTVSQPATQPSRFYRVSVH